LDEWRHAGTEVDNDVWTSLCGSGTGNSSVGAVSHESRPPRMLAGATVHRGSLAWWRWPWLAISVEAVMASRPAMARRQLGGGRRGRLGPVENVAWRRQCGETAGRRP
jgi:hypothetical protein